MARRLGKLTEVEVRRLGAGWHSDGGGLYLRVAGKEQRWWAFRYGAGGRRYHGLGSTHTIGLAEAREQARRCRQLLLQGVDPIAAGKATRAAAKLTEANARTFRQCAEAFHAAHCASWSNRKHAREWLASLVAHVFPAIGGMPVAAVDTPEILRVLQPAWTAIPETASRLRSRIEAVLDWARVHGYRSGENPARWRGHLDHLLPDRKRIARVVHHRALPYRAIPDLVAKLQARTEIEPRALEFVLLTAARASEACGADWREIDLTARIWTVPAERMKGRREHRVPLAPAAVAILERTPKERRHGPVFPNGTRRGKTVTVIALWRLAQELSGGGTTTHGLRSAFRDWSGEQTSFAREIIELALAHVVGGDTELAYRRGDMLEKRRPLMDAWASYCTGTPLQASTTSRRSLRAPMAKKQPPPVARIGRIVGEPYYTEDGRKFARMVFDPLPEAEPAPKKSTRKQEMILAIVRRDFRGRSLPSVAVIFRHIRDNKDAVWKAECARQRPPVDLGAPGRDMIAYTLEDAGLIKPKS